MSKEQPTDDPRERIDEASISQTDKPWKGIPEKEQSAPNGEIDLENWQRSKTH